jgi:hypothetical protein
VEATRLLKQAEDALTVLAASGRLAGLEDKCQKWMEAIRKNLQLIAIRAEQRTKPEGSAGPGPAGRQRP